MSRKRKFRIPPTPELLRVSATREARRVGQYGWRPTPHDLVQLKASTSDARAYRMLFRGWRAAGFKVRAIRKLAGRVRNSEFRTQSAKAPDAAFAS
jgi:hypothetical protein